MADKLKYIGATDFLGEIESESCYYWLVHPYRQDSKGKTFVDFSRVVSFPKWSTRVVKDDSPIIAVGGE